MDALRLSTLWTKGRPTLAQAGGWKDDQGRRPDGSCGGLSLKMPDGTFAPSERCHLTLKLSASASLAQQFVIAV